ncbi:MAG: zf-HC2 domain-containing protein [Solirubrobacteraceae bacterium]
MSQSDGSRPEPSLTGPLGRVLGPVGPEVSCERCFELLDAYVDLELCGGDAELVMPGMRAHLEGCPACGEDHESLRDFVAATDRQQR